MMIWIEIYLKLCTKYWLLNEKQEHAMAPLITIIIGT